MTNDTCLHRILVKRDVPEVERRLREHGYEPRLGDTDPHYGTAVDFAGPQHADLDFLRPEFLPPRDT